MTRSLQVTLILGCTLAASINAQCPIIPLKYTESQNVDVIRALGVWYEYMYHTNPRQDPPDTNVMHNATATGTYAGTFHEPTRAISWITRFYRGRISSAEPLECGSITYQGNMTIHGKRATKALTGHIPGIIRSSVNVLFTDHNFVQIMYGCSKINADAERCDQYRLWIDTRVPPPQLTTVQKKYIASAANYYLPRISKSISDLSLTTWDLRSKDPYCSSASAFETARS